MSDASSPGLAAPGLTEAHRALLDRFATGDRSALARVISVVEDERPGFESLLDAILARGLRAARVGITGPPGAGKSTLVAALATAYRARGEQVGIVAVDPTSPFTGGALLGDRIRMNELATDPGIFIRSMATRGARGGLATTTREVIDVMDSFGFDRLLVETVGVGQADLEVASAADTVVVALVPESGDAIQAMKAGLMEIADIFVVNKADRPGADRVAREIELTLQFRRGVTLRHVPAHHGVDLPRMRARGATGTSGRQAGEAPGDPGVRADWTIPVLKAVAQSGEGVAELLDALDRHRAYLTESGELQRRRRTRTAARLRDAVERELRRLVWGSEQGRRIAEEWLDKIAAGKATPYAVARQIIAELTGRLYGSD
ncbi:MAG: methylmalonyl Co-A mutase-associated GTPase MeaB [Gemmatimonadetes bacterium]|nr:methylmalonyl Co-A mutase-associated GTPase MeaB [Gemmatimonadota bacterium]